METGNKIINVFIGDGNLSHYIQNYVILLHKTCVGPANGIDIRREKIIVQEPPVCMLSNIL